MQIIFHHPLPLDLNARSASGIRPIRMLNAFKNLGYEVDLAVGYSFERKSAIHNILKKIKNGVKYDFCYSESSTTPTLLCDKNHLPLYPFLDFSFFIKLKRNNIPIGLFYRDIYWRFPEFQERIGIFKTFITSFFYKYDLLQYSKLLNKLYLPSEEMAKYISIKNRNIIKALPPAFNYDNPRMLSLDKLSIIYIGGISSHYKMQKLFSVVKKHNNIHFIICTRKEEWETVKDQYSQYMGENIEIVHKYGSELSELYANSNCSSLFVEPQEYRKFAVPVKLFEYIGNLKPVIASENTYVGNYVKKHDIGWTIPYDEKALDELLTHLENFPEEINEKMKKCNELAHINTWNERAKEVINDLKGKNL